MYLFISKLINYLVVHALLLVVLLAAIGQIYRDYTIWLTWFLYIPLIPLGAIILFWDRLQRGRSLRWRYSFSIVGVMIIAWEIAMMVQVGYSQCVPSKTEQAETGQSLKILHWNVYWGGKFPFLKNYTQAWESLKSSVIQQNADVIILTEPPQNHRLPALVKTLGDDWQMINFQPQDHCRHNCIILSVLSPWPMQLEEQIALENGDGFIITLAFNDKQLRLFVVDGIRDLSILRTPLLNHIAQIVEVYHQQEKPIDIIAGDFNAVARSRGFDQLTTLAGGYQLAGRITWGWRGTWMTGLPLYAIDHVWVNRRFCVAHTQFISNLASDHRGQLVTILLNETMP